MHLFCFGLMLYFCVFPPVPYLVREVSSRLHPTDRNGVEQSTLSLHRPETLFRFLSLCLACTFALSVAYHVGMNCCHSARSYAVLLQCDVAGILFSITGSVAVYFYKGNACFMTSPPDAGHAHQQLVYQVLFYAMGVASLLTAYVLCFQSKRAPLAGAAGGGLTSLQRRVPAVFVLCHLVDYGFLSLGALWEHLRGVPLAPPHPQKSDNVLLRQIFRSRRRVQVAAEALDGTREPQPTVPSAVPMSTSRRAVILCGYSALHLLTYLVIIYPKTFKNGHPSGGDPYPYDDAEGEEYGDRDSQYARRSYVLNNFIDADYYHFGSYMFLLLGCLCNASRFPERFIYHMHRIVKKEIKREKLREAQVQTEWRLYLESHRQNYFRATHHHLQTNHSNSSNNNYSNQQELEMKTISLFSFLWLETYVLRPLFMNPLAFLQTVKRFVYRLVLHFFVSRREICLVGHSHQIWHFCAAMSSFFTLLGCYYDCLEFELMVCNA
ncbi:hypothetical protein STCU_07674 [Strigomonas culicis]|uniref:Uncharacterized protein n=1 Tax=Strigomonas culicis TaxID=28005 RepID=S9VJW9_9TRYP|nr:hypothetical protein STCU_07674 [Strigomonas culicis]|eukprot:EPY23535.1 hypothetical protein STCU_07674 [Strigomonas culicis]